MSNETERVRHEKPVAGLTRRTLSGFVWTFSGTGFRVVLHVVVLSVLARLLTPGDFGLVGAVLVVVSLSNIFARLGVGPALVQRPKIRNRHLQTGLATSLLLGLALWGLVFWTAPCLARFFRMQDLTPLLRAMSPVFLVNGLCVAPEACLQRELRFGRLACVETFSFALGYGLLGIILAALGWGVWALLAGHLGQAVLRLIALMVVQPYPKGPAFSYGAFKELMLFGSGFTLARIANYAAGQGDNLVVGRCLGAQALGIYGRAYQLMAMPAGYFDQAVSKVLFPSMALIQEDPGRLSSAFRRSTALTALIALPMSAVAVVLGPDIVFVLLGSQWEAVIVPFQVLAFGMFFRTSSKVSNSLVRAKGAVGPLAGLQIVYAVLVIFGSWLAHPYGVAGVALAVFIAIVCQFLLFTRISLKITSLRWGDVLRQLFPALRLSLGVFVFSWLAAALIRPLGMPAAVTLIITVGLLAGCVALLVKIAPVATIGRDGHWLLQTLRTSVQERLNMSATH